MRFARVAGSAKGDGTARGTLSRMLARGDERLGVKAAARRGGGEVAHVQEQEEVSLLIWVHASSVD